MIQEWWGLDDSLKKLVERFAAEGSSRSPRTSAAAAWPMLSSLPVEQATKALSGGVDLVLGHEAVTSGTVGVVGFAWAAPSRS